MEIGAGRQGKPTNVARICGNLRCYQNNVKRHTLLKIPHKNRSSELGNCYSLSAYPAAFSSSAVSDSTFTSMGTSTNG